MKAAHAAPDAVRAVGMVKDVGVRVGAHRSAAGRRAVPGRPSLRRVSRACASGTERGQPRIQTRRRGWGEVQRLGLSKARHGRSVRGQWESFPGMDIGCSRAARPAIAPPPFKISAESAAGPAPNRRNGWHNAPCSPCKCEVPADLRGAMLSLTATARGRIGGGPGTGPHPAQISPS